MGVWECGRWRGAGVALTFLALAVVVASVAPPVRAQEKTLTVFAAASLTDAFSAIQPAFERKKTGVKVRFSFGASSALRTQIEQGAPADVFASADYASMQPLVSAKTVSVPRTFARNRLVLVTPAANPGKIGSIKDLAKPGLRFVTTDPAVPIGRYTQDVLGKLALMKGYGADYATRVNANVVSREANVRAVLAKVELGEADAGIVYETDGRGSKKVKMLPILEKANVVAEYPIAVVAGSANRPAAEAFTRFVLSGEGRAALKRFGFR